jgi:hypothetical protein
MYESMYVSGCVYCMYVDIYSIVFVNQTFVSSFCTFTFGMSLLRNTLFTNMRKVVPNLYKFPSKLQLFCFAGTVNVFVLGSCFGYEKLAVVFRGRPTFHLGLFMNSRFSFLKSVALFLKSVAFFLK